MRVTCRHSGQGSGSSRKEGRGHWPLQIPTAGARSRAEASPRGSEWERVRGRGARRGRGPPCAPSAARAPLRELALWLAGHAAPGAAGAPAPAAAGTGAARGALPRAVQLPAPRRPALPRPARRPRQTVSTAPPPGTLARSGTPCLPTLCSP